MMMPFMASKEQRRAVLTLEQGAEQSFIAKDTPRDKP